MPSKKVAPVKPTRKPPTKTAAATKPAPEIAEAVPAAAVVVVSVPVPNPQLVIDGLTRTGFGGSGSALVIFSRGSKLPDAYQRAGFVLALADSGLQVEAGDTIVDDARELLGGFDPGSGPEWNAYFCGRYAAAREKTALAELVRRAIHRDGSTWSITTGSDALQILEQVSATSPDLAVMLKRESGVDVGALQFGDFPGLSVIPDPAQPAAAAIEAPAATLPASQFQAAAASAIAAPVSLGGSRVVVSGSTLSIGGAPIAIAAAVVLGERIQEAVYGLTIPGEAFAWDDYLDGVGGRLVCRDEYLAKAAKYELKDGVYVAAEVKQSDGADGYAIGAFRCEVFGPGADRKLFFDVADYWEAKAKAAGYVRPLIPAV